MAHPAIPRSNSDLPGAIATGILGKAWDFGSRRREKTPESCERFYKDGAADFRRTGAGRHRHAAVFLASDAIQFHNGHDWWSTAAITAAATLDPQQQGMVAVPQGARTGRG